MGALHVTLLGGFQLERDGRALPPIPAVAGRSLLAYVLLDDGRSHPREVVSGALWPDLDEPKARRRLSQTLWQIQTVLGDGEETGAYLLTSPSGIRFNGDADLWVDVREFEESLDRAAREPGGALRSLERAVELYRGDLLAGFYDDWFALERERLSMRYLGAIEQLVAVHKGSGRYERALQHARRLSLHDPFRESAHREVMRLSHLLGRSHEAMAQYEVLESLLREEIGVEPSAETRALAIEIRELQTKGVRPFVPAPSSPLFDERRSGPLVGRRREREGALSVIESALTGRGGIVLVEGAAGTGKTKLLAALGDDAAWRGAGIGVAACGSETMLRPYGVVRDLLLSMLTPLRARQVGDAVAPASLVQVAGVVPELERWVGVPPPAPLPADGSRQLIRAALVEALMAIGGSSPTVLFIDDLQWIDVESLAVVDSLTRMSQQQRMAVIIAYEREPLVERPGLWDIVQQLDRTENPIRIELAGLDLQETVELIERAMGSVAVRTELAESIYFETGGNPLFVLETLRALEPGAMDAAIDHIPFAGGVRAVIERRISALDAETARVLQALAVLGDEGQLDVLADVSGRNTAGFTASVQVLLRRGMIDEVGDGVRFRHGQIRSVALQLIDAEQLRRLHRAAAAAFLNHTPDRAADVARHLAGAGDLHEAARYAWMAASMAVELTHAYGTARAHLESARDLFDAGNGSVEERFDVAADLERVLDVLGDREAEAGAIERMAAVAGEDRVRMFTVLGRRANLHTALGEFEQAMASAAGALEHAITGEELARGYRTIGEIDGYAGRTDQAALALDAALQNATGSALEGDIHRVYGSMLAAASRHDESMGHLRRAVELFVDDGDERGLAEAKSAMGTVEMERGNQEAALEAYAAAIETARRIGYRRYEGIASVNLGNLLFTMRRPAEALSRYGEASRILESIGDRRAEAFARTNRAMLLHQVFGDDEAAAAEARVALPLWRSLDIPVGEAQCQELLGRIALRSGRLDDAGDHLAAGFLVLDTAPNPWLEAHYGMLAADVELAAGRVGGAREHLERAGRLIRDGGFDALSAQLNAGLGLVALASGDVASAVVHSSAAVSGGDPDHLVWHRRWIVMTGAGRDEEAAEAATSAWRAVERLIGDLDPPVRTAAMHGVPEYGRIRDAFDAVASRLAPVELPSTGGPVSVTWTLSTPADLLEPDLIARRRLRLVRLLAEAGEAAASAPAEAIAAVLEVSVATIRRDLGTLRRGV